MSQTTTEIDRQSIADFLYDEAEMLDERRFLDWFALFTEDSHYWIPLAGTSDPQRHVSIIYDDHKLLAERTKRLSGHLAYAQIPQSRTSHLVGNIRITEADSDEITVTSRLVVTEFRRSERHVHSGLQEHRLQQVDGGFRIRLKRVDLIDNDGRLGNLSIIL